MVQTRSNRGRGRLAAVVPNGNICELPRKVLQERGRSTNREQRMLPPGAGANYPVSKFNQREAGDVICPLPQRSPVALICATTGKLSPQQKGGNAV